MHAVALTRELVRFDTINPPGNERPCAERVGALLEGAGFAVTYHELGPGRASLVARLGRGEGALCFTGHLDTVPLGTAPWSHAPHAGETDGGRLYGRGSSDMKSGVAAFVVAATRLAPHLARTCGLVLVITAAEETGCEGAAALAGRSGALGAAGAIVVAEPTCNYPFVGHKGALWLRARTTGITAHGSMPERGVNAIYKAARAVTKLERLAFDALPHPVLGAPTLNVGVIAGGLNVNSVPDACIVEIDIRTIPEQKHAQILERLREELGEDVALETVTGADGVWTDAAHPWVREVFELATPIVGARPDVRGAPYFTDASYLTPAYGNAPTVILGPGELPLAHQTDEYCLVERIEQATELFTAIARRWTGA